MRMMKEGRRGKRASGYVRGENERSGGIRGTDAHVNYSTDIYWERVWSLWGGGEMIDSPKSLIVSIVLSIYRPTLHLYRY